MKIALIGYGKMGRMIEGIALERGNEITCRIDRDNPEDFDSEAFRSSEVAIEFTTPSTAVENIERCFRAGIPVVCGTTGWVNEPSADGGGTRLDEMHRICDEGKGTLMWASNFSIGVNIFMAVNRYLAGIMESFAQYSPSMTETHHVHKLDHPSGTAITLAEQIEASNRLVKGWVETGTVHEEGVMEIGHVRRGEVPGIHTIVWNSPVDDITITHSAKSRAGFALGAVTAAEWLAGKRGFRTLGEMLDEITKQNIFK